MDIKDLTTLTKNSQNRDLYNLTQRTFQFLNGEFNKYIVQPGEGMRIDLVCNSIYGNTNFIDILLNINNIDNPLNIKEGVTLLYPDLLNIESFRFDDKKQKEISKQLADKVSLNTPTKANRKDDNRQNYVKNNLSLPPTILNEPVDQITLTDNKIVIGTGLFNK